VLGDRQPGLRTCAISFRFQSYSQVASAALTKVVRESGAKAD
jgi:hypothetical protein